jgi:hypothetical protein
MDKWLLKRVSDKCEQTQTDICEVVVAERGLSISSEPSISYFENPAEKKTKFVCTGKLRKYDSAYLKIGFVSLGENEEKPLCKICLKTLANDAMTPRYFFRH